MATIVCINCGKEFDFSKVEEDFYKKQGYLQPKRCRECRAKKRAVYNQREGNK